MADTTDINALISQYEIRPGRPYLSPAHLMQVDRGWSGAAPYSIIGEITLKPFMSVNLGAPELPRAKQNYMAVQSKTSAVLGSGGAPTNGIYTGVEDHCG